MMGIGALLAGLYFLLQAGWPWWKAQRSGVIFTQGYRPQKVERDLDPERFKSLSDRRLKAARGGLLISGGGVLAATFSAAVMMFGA